MSNTGMCVHFVPVGANLTRIQRLAVILRLEVGKGMEQNRNYHHLDGAVTSGVIGTTWGRGEGTMYLRTIR